MKRQSYIARLGYLIIFASWCVLISSPAWAACLPDRQGSHGPPDGTGEGAVKARDTVAAVVMYGDRFLLDEFDGQSEDQVYVAIDSLMCLEKVPYQLVRQLYLYMQVLHMNQQQLLHLIDSLFDADRVPYALINQINLYVSTHELKEDESLWFEGDTSQFPANGLYQQWNTWMPNPYTFELSENDTTLYLVLAGTEKLENYVQPYVGEITSKFGWRSGRQHSGVDIDLEVWDTVVVAFPGMVRVARWHEGYGRVVVVRHYNGLETTYAHLHRIKVKPGQVVGAGELIGLGGSSGKSTGSHLHFECRFKGLPLNPMSFISFSDNRLVNDTLILKRMKWNYVSYPKGTKLHTVQWGDHLYGIAQRYGTTIRSLRELNGLRRNSMLRVGQEIRVI